VTEIFAVKKTAAIYVRVSTASKVRGGADAVFEQIPEVQELPLRQLAEQRSWSVVRVYSDRASGAKENRPGLKDLMADARRGAFNVVLVWRFDRFARSVEQLVSALAEFRSLKVDFVSHQESLDTSTAMGKAMFTVIAAVAELERCVIRERVQAGLDYARKNGTKSGRAIGRPRAVFNRGAAADLQASGLSLRQIARKLGVSEKTIRRIWSAGVGSTGVRQNPSSKIADSVDQTNNLQSR
jgi:DNA invertase Pin-like site-specific DNA recombinase